MARKFSDDEFDDIDISDEEIVFVDISEDEECNDEAAALEEDEDEESDYGRKPRNSSTHGRKWLAPVIAVVIIVCCVAGYIIVRNTPNKAHEDLYKLYGLEKDSSEIAIVVDHKILETKGYYIDGFCYIPESVVTEFFTDNLYYDKNNRCVLYTTENGTDVFPIGEKFSEQDGKTTEYEYPVVKYLNDELYVCVEFLALNFGSTNRFIEAPSRIVLETPGKEYDKAMASGGTIRTGMSIKNKIIGSFNEGINWYFLDEAKGYFKLVSEDGRVGYIEKKSVPSVEKIKTKEYSVAEYANQLRDHNIVLVWDGIYVAEENAKIQSRLEGVKNVNVISPTWYKIISTEGDIESFADEKYLEYVREQGLEVWPLINDFLAGKEDGFDEKELLSNTEYRRNLISNIMSEISKYGFEGINIDFEKIKEDYGKDFVQFMRELSVECRKEKVVLSVDLAVPFNFNRYYGRKALGRCVDYIMVMCYDEHYDGGPAAGTTASISYLEKGINDTALEVDKKKIIAGVPFYSRLWQIEAEGYEINNETHETTGKIIKTTAVSMNAADSVIAEYNLTTEWNDDLKQSVASGIYDGFFYQIWLETMNSMEFRVEIIAGAQIAGSAAWVLGSEDKRVWELFSKINS